MQATIVKICGLKEPETLQAALDAGADLVGLVSFPRSPRHVELDAMAALAQQVRRHGGQRAQIVVLSVDADDSLLRALDQAVQPDWWQFHGQEDSARIEAVRAMFGRPIIKAVGVSGAQDIQHANAMGAVADRLLLDAKPPKGATRPGGLGEVFDWSLLGTIDPALAFMLSGGLTPANVGEAISITGALAVDVSSGVESAPGIKDSGLIAQFIAAAKAAVRPATQRIRA